MANDLKGYYNLNNGNELKRLLKEKFNYSFSVRKRGLVHAACIEE